MAREEWWCCATYAFELDCFASTVQCTSVHWCLAWFHNHCLQPRLDEVQRVSNKHKAGASETARHETLHHGWLCRGVTHGTTKQLSAMHPLCEVRRVVGVKGTYHERQAWALVMPQMQMQTPW